MVECNFFGSQAAGLYEVRAGGPDVLVSPDTVGNH